MLDHPVLLNHLLQISDDIQVLSLKRYDLKSTHRCFNLERETSDIGEFAQTIESPALQEQLCDPIGSSVPLLHCLRILCFLFGVWIVIGINAQILEQVSVSVECNIEADFEVANER